MTVRSHVEHTIDTVVRLRIVPEFAPLAGSQGRALAVTREWTRLDGC